MNNLNIYNADCFVLLEQMKKEGKKFNAIITDPPYAIARETSYGVMTELDENSTAERKKIYNTYKNHHCNFGDWDQEEIDFDKLVSLCYDLLEDGGTLFMFYDIWKIQNIKETAERYKFKQARMGFWVKTNPIPINSRLNYLTNSKEIFVTFTKKSKPTFNSKYDNAIYSYPACHGKERTKHTTQKPLILMEDIVLKHTNKGDSVLDPFMGSGTTGEASLKHGRVFTGIERDEEYFKICKKRLEGNKDSAQIDENEW